MNKVLGLLPGSIRTLSEPPLYPCPKIFDGIHFRVKLGQEMVHHPRLSFDKLYPKK
jgi:hypothetical protein